MNLLIVGGNFDQLTGKHSKIVSKLYDQLSGKFTTELINGGNIQEIADIDFLKYDVVFWSPNISNSEQKIIPNIKAQNKKILLISTKRVIEKSYTDFDVVGHLLKNKSNLGIKITRTNDAYSFKLIDPLGNEYYSGTDIIELCQQLSSRIYEIKNLTRIPSKQIGPARAFEINKDFIQFVKHSAGEFSHYVNAVNPNRLLGNASTRCMFGFPAEKQNERIFVTQRNINKELIDSNGFVEVSANKSLIEYYGNNKPSVDTPIQIRLFDYYKNINFIVHGHVYVDGAKSTRSKIPCGYIEEFNEITELYPDANTELIVVNLTGHGCLILAKNVEDLWNYGSYKSRPFTEK